jgi:hypothetical protein
VTREVTRHGRRVAVLSRGHVRDIATGVEFLVHGERWHPRMDTWASFATQRGALRALTRAEAACALVGIMLAVSTART